MTVKVGWTPAPDGEALSLLGEGIHTSLRKIGDTEEAANAWAAISNMAPGEWSKHLEWTLWGIRESGYDICKKEIQ